MIKRALTLALALSSVTIPKIFTHVSRETFQKMWDTAQAYVLDGGSLEPYLTLLESRGNTYLEILTLRRQRGRYRQEAAALIKKAGGIERFIQAAVARTMQVMSGFRENPLVECSEVLANIRRLLSRHNRPIVVAVDGRSGAGKSTFASWILSRLDTAPIPLDDFFSGNIPDHRWAEFTPEKKLKHVLDWERLRHQVIDPLIRGQAASWRAFDFAAGLRADGTYSMQEELKRRESAEVILIEGAYSAGPELADLVDLAILVDVPVEECHSRLEAREERGFPEQWHSRWAEVEDLYFSQVRTRDSFDVVVSNE